MFDDIPTQGGTVPPNLPMGEPEDIFAAVPESGEDHAMQPTASPAMDDSPPAKTALSAGMLQPKAGEQLSSPGETAADIPTMVPPPVADAVVPPVANIQASTLSAQTSSPPVPPAASNEMKTHTMPGDAPELYSLKEPKASKGIITIIIVVVVVAVLGGGGLFIYNQFVAGSSQSTDLPTINTGNTDNNTLDSIDTTNNTVNITDDAPQVTTTNSTDTTTINRPDEATNDVLFGEPTDTDADGLDDVREEGLGTDPAHWDTDGDELSDGDEVIIWKTDPLNPDTDGDTFPDGIEIKNGYSPTGPGKIFEPPTESATSTL